MVIIIIIIMIIMIKIIIIIIIIMIIIIMIIIIMIIIIMIIIMIMAVAAHQLRHSLQLATNKGHISPSTGSVQHALFTCACRETVNDKK